MILAIFRYAGEFSLRYFWYLIYNSRKNPRNIFLGRITTIELFSWTTKLTEYFARMNLNNCAQKKSIHQTCIKQRPQILNHKSKIPIKIQVPKLKQTSKKPDLPSIVMLLQAVGFQLRQFEKQKVVEGENATKKESIQVIINCGTSQMKAVLEMDGIECQCPNEENETKGGSLWSICGHAPGINESGCSSKYEESGSNLLPSIPKGVNNVVRDVVYRLFKTMNDPSSINNLNSVNDLNVSAIGNIEQTPDSKKLDSLEGFSRSRTQPNITSICDDSRNINLLASKNLFRSTFSINDATVAEISKNDAQIRGGTLQRQKTWDIDTDLEMEPNFPKLGVSPTPVEEMCISLGQISVGSEDESIGFIDYVVKAYRNLDKAVNFLAKKAPISSSLSSLNEQSFVKPTTSAVKSASSTPRTTSRPGSACSVPSRLSQKISPAKPLNRKRISTPISQKSTHTLPGTTPLRRQCSNTSTGPQKPIPPRLTAPRLTAPKLPTPKLPTTSNLPAPKGRAYSSPSMNMSLNDKVLVKNQPSLDLKNKLPAARKTSVGASNTSLRSPLTSSKTIPQSSTGTLGTKYGLSRIKK